MKKFNKRFPDLTAEQLEAATSQELSDFYQRRIAQEEGWRAAIRAVLKQSECMGGDHMSASFELLLNQELEE